MTTEAQEILAALQSLSDRLPLTTVLYYRCPCGALSRSQGSSYACENGHQFGLCAICGPVHVGGTCRCEAVKST